MTAKAIRKLVVFASLVVSCFTILPISFRASMTSFQVEIGQKAYAQNRTLKKAFGLIGERVFGKAVDYALDNLFNPKEDQVAPVTRATGAYIGSSFVGNPVSQGRRVTVHLFATRSGEWWGWYSTQGRWVPMGSPPPFQVYRTGDIYRDSSGNLFLLPPS